MENTASNLRRFHSLLLLLLTFPISRSLGVVDSIAQGQSLRYGETLVSAGGVFELGFFSPNGTSKHYLGIWYKQITKENVVWVANREDPLTNTTGVLNLTIDKAGNLVILNEAVAVVYSLYISPSQANSSSAVLLDSGNFVLRNETGGVVWQSFDHPTDTFLAGMKLGLDTRTGKKLTSWTSSSDPAPGSYSLGLDRDEPRRLVIRRKDESISWNSGFWNGEIFSLVPEMRSMFNYTLVESGNAYYFIYALYNSSTLPKLVMDPSGELKLRIWSQESKDWASFWYQPKDECELYNSCGANSRCNTSGPNLCNCLDGFEGDLSRHQQSSLWERRCVRHKNITCTDDGDYFLNIEGVRFPDRSWYEGNGSMSIGDCEIGCRRNCSCSAYASSYSNGTGGCLFWAGDLIGLRDSPPYAVDNGFAMGNIFVRVAASDGVKKRRIHVIIGVVVPLTVIFVSCILCYLLRWRKLKTKGEVDSRKELLPLDLSTDLSEAKEFVQASNFGHGGRSRDLPFFSFAVIETATDNFSHANMLGQGGFGPVYKGRLTNGQEIAVKRLSRSSGQGLEEFKNEVMVISKLQHRNLVRLLGWCVHGEEKILIYEYMSNKSLQLFLFDQTKKSTLDWGKRIQIIEGIAQGLLYLHQYSRITVIHRDLKPSNILLDDSMNPKISDFGTARIFGGDQCQANTKRVVGTYGYMSPEYGMEGIFSVKSDVFSFGVILLEIVSGKKNAAAHYFDGSVNLLGYVESGRRSNPFMLLSICPDVYNFQVGDQSFILKVVGHNENSPRNRWIHNKAWELWKDGRISELIDPILVDSAPAQELERHVHVAFLCVQNSSVCRPTMLEVVHMLTNKAATLNMPEQPAFSIQRVAEADGSSSKPTTCSVSDITVSEINEGR